MQSDMATLQKGGMSVASRALHRASAARARWEVKPAVLTSEGASVCATVNAPVKRCSVQSEWECSSVQLHWQACAAQARAKDRCEMRPSRQSCHFPPSVMQRLAWVAA